MKNALKAFSCPHNASASVVDGKLILSLPDAITPVVWQMDFSAVKASALEVRENKDGAFTLTLKTPKGEALDIAPFAKREQAINGLMAAAHALENAQGRIRPVEAGATETQGSGAYVSRPAKRGTAGKWVGTIIALVVLFVLIGAWASYAPRPPSGLSETASGNTAAPANPEPDSGVPLSADEFLRGQ